MFQPQAYFFLLTCWIVHFLLWTTFSYGLDVEKNPVKKDPTTPQEANTKEANPKNPYTEVEIQYRGVKLGMDFSQVRKLIVDDIYLEVDETTRFGYFDRPRQHVLKARSMPYLRAIYYQFYTLPTTTDEKTADKKPLLDRGGNVSGNANKATDKPAASGSKNELYGITIHFNPKFHSIGKLLEVLRTKYGPPTSHEPNTIRWVNTKNPDWQLILTRSVVGRAGEITLQYLDLARLRKSQELLRKQSRILNQVLKEKRQSALLEGL